jgi:hypothetical protein
MHSALLAALGDAELESELGHSARSSCAPPTPSSSSTFQCELDELRARKSALQGELESLGVQLAASSVSMETASSELQQRQRAATGAIVWPPCATTVSHPRGHLSLSRPTKSLPPELGDAAAGPGTLTTCL